MSRRQYIDAVQFHSLGTVYADLSVVAVQGDLGELIQFCLTMMLPGGVGGEERIQQC